MTFRNRTHISISSFKRNNQLWRKVLKRSIPSRPGPRTNFFRPSIVQEATIIYHRIRSTKAGCIRESRICIPLLPCACISFLDPSSHRLQRKNLEQSSSVSWKKDRLTKRGEESQYSVEMEATQDRTRKRTALNTACWDCYRYHRACDGLRPCKRCDARGRGPSCRDPAPNERIPRKRKRSKSKKQRVNVFHSYLTRRNVVSADPQICRSSKMP